MPLNKPDSYLPHDHDIEIAQVSKKGKAQTVIIKSWDNMLLRGSRKYHSSDHPFNALQVTLYDENGQAVFKRPM